METRTAGRNRRRESYRRQNRISNTKRRRIIIVCILLAVLSFAYVRNVINLKVENARLKEENEQLVEKRDALKKKLKNVDNVTYIEEQARKQLQLMYPDELLFKFHEDEETKSNE